MVTHILKLIKAQFRSNSWVLAELLVVFVVMWFMADYFLMQGVLMNRPVGFKLDNVYQAVVSLRPAESPSFIQYEEGSEEPLQNFERIIERIGRHPDVEVVGLSYYSLPYTFSNMGDGIRRDSIRLNVRNMMVSPDYLQVFGIHSAEGESPEEMARKLSELVSTKDLMISGELARSLFDRTDILGKEVYMSGDSIPKRIVVVTEPVRNDEYDAGDMNVFFTRMDLTAMQREWGMKESDFTDVQVTFRTRPGSTLPDYAQHFLKEMKLQLKAGNFWVSDIKRFENIRTDGFLLLGGQIRRVLTLRGFRLRQLPLASAHANDHSQCEYGRRDYVETLLHHLASSLSGSSDLSLSDSSFSDVSLDPTDSVVTAISSTSLGTLISSDTANSTDPEAAAAALLSSCARRAKYAASSSCEITEVCSKSSFSSTPSAAAFC